ncbi:MULTISPECIES: 1-acyl-sn-glycerol-3-phosphate acyltransferase [unclassified Novosphingobium]|uniref:lysophospholipid acyltransferase family protein n=1 Tax=unclassified Novosphingobium TaxID=2644732 RepID=UPI00020EE89B|nr:MULTISPECIES: lysophospholipid acyltransferase family protein [unclassified Novosphingobium]GFM28396.1 1-acyl-sn-glycerol-3-phosphate acyltransferase [Novosphingobium sp. PY1]CCA91553.1 1-acyl-sn-glycerol-3-phosphate acyltransferase [Novosphingobium sp. PP1Y]
MRSTPADVLRSLAFYAAFYTGSIFYVLGFFLAARLGEMPARRVVRGWSRYHRACARWLLGMRVVVEGEMPNDGVLVAIKHESFFEAIDLPSLMDWPVPFPKAELARIPGWGAAAMRYGIVVVEREEGAKALRAMVANARHFAARGRPLAIFPEGTRVAHGTRGELQSGFAGVYKLLGLPVVPVAVDSGRLYHRRWKKPGVITVRVGERIEAGLPRKEVEARVTEAINALNR